MTVAEYQVPPRDNEDDRFHRRQIANAISLMMQGKTNNVLDVTIPTGNTSTTISDARISAFTVPIPVPANAQAAEAREPYRDYSTAVNGSMILTTNTLSSTATYKMILVG